MGSSQHNGRVFRYLASVENRTAFRATGHRLPIYLVPVLGMVDHLAPKDIKGFIGEGVFDEDPLSLKLRSHFFHCHLLFHSRCLSYALSQNEAIQITSDI